MDTPSEMLAFVKAMSDAERLRRDLIDMIDVGLLKRGSSGLRYWRPF
jgi:hypothetical protein